jgi:ubiquinone/menaquinone biosynthesis C-methylase UbiE
MEENSSILELACGTGIVTRVLRSHLPASVKLTATDLNEAMFQNAMSKFAKDENVRWLQADACSLPFPDSIFDAVVCQFGIMFVSDKALAAREAHRVLKPGRLLSIQCVGRDRAQRAGPAHPSSYRQLLR